MIQLLDGTGPNTPFPPPREAEKEPDGLLAVGGDLSPQRLINAYRAGVFPWYGHGQPILWWSPDPRMVLLPQRLHVSRSMRKLLRRGYFRISFDADFSAVIRACAEHPRDGEGTWISEEMIAAYEALHRRGVAHSAEAWLGDELAGGCYGVMLGQVFFGESMFSYHSNASKAAFITLVQALANQGCRMIDCQVYTPHLQSLGAELMPREEFLARLQHAVRQPAAFPVVPC